MLILRAETKDIDTLLGIYDKAKKMMIASGNPNQWTNGYPSREVIAKDIQAQSLFICLEDQRAVGCFVLSLDDEPSYAKIYQGQWLNDSPYSVIHRFAVLEHGKGIGTHMLNWCLARGRSIRVDTHADNAAMQALLQKCGFQYCGIIRLATGDERLAYQIGF